MDKSCHFGATPSNQNPQPETGSTSYAPAGAGRAEAGPSCVRRAGASCAPPPVVDHTPPTRQELVLRVAITCEPAAAVSSAEPPTGGAEIGRLGHGHHGLSPAELLTPKAEALERRRAVLLDRAGEATTEEELEAAETDPELARVDLELVRLGHPTWHTVPSRFTVSALVDITEREEALYLLHLQRRAWLASTDCAPAFPVGHGWRGIFGPTPHPEDGSPSVRAELIVPARVAVVDEAGFTCETSGGAAVATEHAWNALTFAATEAERVGLDPAELLGVSLETCRVELELAMARADCAIPGRRR